MSIPSRLALASAFALAACAKPAPPPKPSAALPTAPLTFPDGKTITVELAVTPETREYGLMNRVSLPEDYGMLFVFPQEQGLQFWMKNTLVNLDMVFIGKDKRVTEVHQDVPRSAPDTPEANLARRSGPAQYVLELPAGAAARRRLAKGRRLDFDVTIPDR